MKIVLQDGIKDCGICALLSIIRFYGGDVSKEYLRELTSTTKSGVSAYKLLLAATKLGFTGYGAKGDIKEINNYINDFDYEIIKTPGHSSDSITFYFKKERES